MKRKSPALTRCFFCQANVDDNTSICDNCSQTVAIERKSGADPDATQQVAVSLNAAHFNAVAEQSNEERDTEATELRNVLTADDYLALVQGPQAKDPDATILVAAQPGHFSARTETAEKADDNEVEATERVAAFLPARLYAQALEQAAAPEKQEAPVEVRAKAAETTLAPKKRSRRRFLAALHLVTDIILLLLLVLAGLGAYNQHLQTLQAQKTWQTQQVLAEQAKVRQQRLVAQQQAAQIQQEAQTQVQQFTQEVNNWSKTHLYRDPYDGHQYPFSSGYAQAGIGSLITQDLSEARTTADYEAVVSETQNALFNFQMLETDYQDHTPYNQVHTSDLQMLKRYQLTQKTVLVVSMVEQVMRVYEQGKLVKAFYVTTGRYERPSLPGIWSILDRQSPTIFKAGDPPGSPYWFPDTPINYAILYHLGGFFVHDAPWRGSFGPGTQFPHLDAFGDTPYNFDGSHGCVNLSETDAAWVYQHTDWNSTIVIY